MTKEEEEHNCAVEAYNNALAALGTASVPIPSGCLWEGPGWEIRLNVLVQGPPCKHCTPFLPQPLWTQPLGKAGYSESRPTWVCPHVVVAYNEGGYASTGVCFDCIRDVEL